MSQDIKYVSTKTQHTWECPGCGRKFEKITIKKWDSFVQAERIAFAETIFQIAEEHSCGPDQPSEG